MNRYSYPATLTPAEEGGYVVTFRDIPEAITQGDSLEDSLAQAAIVWQRRSPLALMTIAKFLNPQTFRIKSIKSLFLYRLP
jgi:hypothetical protein